jgi:hypothetical protein
MKTSGTATITLSGRLALRLQEFSQVAMTTVDELVDHLLRHELEGFPDIGTLPRAFGRYIHSQNYSQAQAQQIANNCNTFLFEESERAGQPLGDQAAIVERRDNESYGVWFPVRRVCRGSAAI